ncbi:MAG: hypothetical protein ACRELC_08200, partial [Gemmatimonadota bacterium]
ILTNGSGPLRGNERLQWDRARIGQKRRPMVCNAFLQGYSEYADGRLPPREQATYDTHRRECEACDRYHAIVRRGVAEYRRLPAVAPSPDFLPRLQHRLYHVDDAGRLASGRHLGSAALVAVASVGFLALAWLPFATRMTVEVELPAVAVEAPLRVESVRPDRSLFGQGPYVTPVTRYWTPVYPALDGGMDLFRSFSLGAPQPPVREPHPALDDSR